MYINFLNIFNVKLIVIWYVPHRHCLLFEFSKLYNKMFQNTSTVLHIFIMFVNQKWSHYNFDRSWLKYHLLFRVRGFLLHSVVTYALIQHFSLLTDFVL